MSELFEALRELDERGNAPRPWELIWNEGPAVGFSDGKPRGTCMRPETIRIIDADNRLLVARCSEPEQTLGPNDMQLIVAAVNAMPEVLAEIGRLQRQIREMTDAIESYAEASGTLVWSAGGLS